MSNTKSGASGGRRAAVAALKAAGRANSDASVMFHAAVAGQLGLNATDTKALSILEREGPLSAGALSERTGLTAASVTSLIDRLEGKRLVRRVEDPADRRKVQVAPDARGMVDVYPIFASFEAGLDALLADFTVAELTLVTRFLTQASALLDAKRQELSGAELQRARRRRTLGG